VTDRSEEKRYEGLSPFEIKNKLIEMAISHSERMMLNAGRGNPNWVALEPRHAFFELGRFALSESERAPIRPGLGGTPKAEGIAQRFQAFLDENARSPGTPLLRRSLDYVRGDLGLDPAEVLLELVDAILGDHYPVPDRMLRCGERIVAAYLAQEMGWARRGDLRFDLFATEGGTAAMTYVFQTLIENKLLHRGDKIALGVPIFTPYLEIPHLNDFEFVELEIRQHEEAGWRYEPAEIEKLADPAVKAFFLVNPSNPMSVALHPETLKEIRELVETRRKDLILLTDDVYGTFVNGFLSLAAVAPRNTILVYSFSKYFGATGWRLGVIGIAEENVLDAGLAALPASDRERLHERYGEVFVDPDGTKLIDRMVADSRTVALHHTAGLSTPQQVFMVLLSLSALTDREGVYKERAQDVVIQRFQTLYRSLGVAHPETPYDAHYYTTIDVPRLAAERYGQPFADHLVAEHEPIDFVWRLAEEKSIVLMDGGGFDAPNMSVRVSLANLPDDAYAQIGKGVSELLGEYHARWQAARS